MRRGPRTLLLALAGLLVAAALVLWGLDALARMRRRMIVRAMPAGWVEIIGARARMPAAALALALPRTDSGDGAGTMDLALRGIWKLMPLDSAYERARSGATTARDTMIWNQLPGDSVLDLWVRAARRSRWDGLDRMLARSGAGASSDLFLLRSADYGNVVRAMETLALRGWVRSDRGDVAGSRADLRAVVGVGEQLLRHEPSLQGFLAGRAAVHAGAQGLHHLAEVTRDSALARRADEAAQWSEPSTAQSYAILPAAPDSALAFARDTSLALGWRVAALRATIEGPLAMPFTRLFGLPARVPSDLDRLASADAGDLGRLAQIAATTARAIDHLAPWTRWSRFSGLGGPF